MAKTPEAKVKEQIDVILKGHWSKIVNPATYGHGKSGDGDKVVCLYGYFVMIEAKAGKNKPTELQKKRLRETHDAGGIAMIINETNISAVKDLAEDLMMAARHNERYMGERYIAAHGMTFAATIQDIPLED